MKSRTLAHAFTGLLSTLILVSQAGASYTVTDLGTLGGTTAQAFAINAAGQVVGQATIGNGTLRAFYYDGTTMHDINDLKDPFLYSNWTLNAANDINDSGQIVGDGLSGSAQTGFLYNPVGTSVTAKAGTGNAGSYANALDSSGRVVGTSYLANNPGQMGAFATGGAQAYTNGPHGRGNDINSSGVTVGTSDTWAQWNVQRAWRMDTTGNVTIIDTLGGTQNQAFGINDAGWIVGQSYTAADAATHAFLYDGSGVIDMDTLGSLGSVAYAINSSGQAVGTCVTGAGSRAFIYSSAVMVDLNSLLDPASGSGWTLTTAWDINGSGLIVGQGAHDGQTRAFLLTPVPEPTSGLLMMLSVTFCLRRRSRWA